MFSHRRHILLIEWHCDRFYDKQELVVLDEFTRSMMCHVTSCIDLVMSLVYS